MDFFTVESLANFIMFLYFNYIFYACFIYVQIIPIKAKLFVSFAFKIVKNYYDINKDNDTVIEDLNEPDNVNRLESLIAVLIGLYVLCYIVLIGLVIFYIYVLQTVSSSIFLVVYLLMTAIFSVIELWIKMLMDMMVFVQFFVIFGMIAVMYFYWEYILGSNDEFNDTIKTQITSYSLIAIPSMILLIQVILVLLRRALKD